jgi:putative transposase
LKEFTVEMTERDERGEAEPAARALRRELFSDELLDRLMSRVDADGVALTGSGGFLPELVKAVLERGMDAELTGHLGYERGDSAGRGSGNSRNGTTPKRVGTEVGDIGLDQPRDRNSTFASSLVPKGVRRLGGLEDMIVSLYAGGMTVRDIQHHLEATLGTEISHETISNVTDAVAEEVTAWQSRPLEPFYPVIYLDAIVVKIRDGAHVSNRAAHIAVGVDMDGVKHVLGIWIQAFEGAKFWASVCSQLANRGVKDVLIVCCDGLTGFPDAVAATWSAATVQTCVVHLIRASMRFVSYGDRKAVAALLRPIYTAADEDAALMALATFADSNLGKKYPSAVGSWQQAWERFTPFLAFGPALRKVIYTTNSIESLNYQLRKIIKNRGHFPSDTAAIKLLWLAIMNIEDKRARERAREQGLPANQRKAPSRLVEGGLVQGWKAALAELTLVYGDRINTYL